MTNRRWYTVICTLAVLLLAAGSVDAKGTPSKVTISGQGLAKSVGVTNAAELQWLGLGRLENLTAPIKAPMNIGAGYIVVRYDGNRPFDHIRYYPGRARAAGYIFYIGIVNGSSEDADKWFRASVRGDSVMRRILSTHGVHLAQ
jgi:hypothetical protein